MRDLPVIRTSERSSHRRCPQHWWWAYRMGLVPKGKQVDARWFGIGIHEALAQWYLPGLRRGPHPADTFEAWCGDETGYAKTYFGENFDHPVWEDARELGISMLESYVEHWGMDPQWHIIAIERPFNVRITRGGKPIAIFRSRWDGVLRDLGDNRVYLLETKTAAQIRLAYLEHDDQAGSYCAVADAVLRAEGVLKPNEHIAGIQYNFLRKAKKDDRPKNELGQSLNKDGSVSKKQPPELFVRPDPVERSLPNQRRQLERLSDEAFIMNLEREGKIPIVKNTSRDCPFCDFWDMCLSHERGGDTWKTIARASYDVRDPYEDDRKSV